MSYMPHYIHQSHLDCLYSGALSEDTQENPQGLIPKGKTLFSDAVAHAQKLNTLIEKSDNILQKVTNPYPEYGYPEYGGYVFYHLYRTIENDNTAEADKIKEYINKHNLMINVEKLDNAPLLHLEIIEKEKNEKEKVVQEEEDKQKKYIKDLEDKNFKSKTTIKLLEKSEKSLVQKIFRLEKLSDTKDDSLLEVKEKIRKLEKKNTTLSAENGKVKDQILTERQSNYKQDFYPTEYLSDKDKKQRSVSRLKYGVWRAVFNFGDMMFEKEIFDKGEWTGGPSRDIVFYQMIINECSETGEAKREVVKVQFKLTEQSMNPPSSEDRCGKFARMSDREIGLAMGYRAVYQISQIGDNTKSILKTS